MKKILRCVLTLLLSFLLLISLGQGTSYAMAENADQEPSVDGYEILGGNWYVGAIYYENNLIDIHDNAAIADLYDSTFLSFDKDGTFTFYKHFFYTGNYTRYNDSGSSNDCFLLNIQSVFQIVFEKGELVKKDLDSSNVENRLVTMTSKANSSFLFNTFDSVSGKAKAGEEPLVFARDGSSSDPFITENKVHLSDSSASKATHPPTKGEKNALALAKSYLAFTSFSYSGLIKQLKYEGFTASEAKYGADHCGADWYKQAAKKAAEYLDLMPFSRSGLIEQLEYEGFTHEEAVYGVNQNGY